MTNSIWARSHRIFGCGLLMTSFLVYAGCRGQGTPLLVSPAQTLEYLESNPPKNLYFNGAAHGALVVANPGWLAQEDRDVRSERVRAMAQAVQNPKLFRQLDRQQRFDVLFLAGDSVSYKPLMDHLVKSGDWGLEWVDAFGLIYRRGKEEAVTMERIRSVAARWESLPLREHAGLLAALAERLVAARRADAAREMLDRAVKVAPNSPAVWAAEGGYRLARGEWAQAVAAADRALKADAKCRPALSVKAQGVYFLKRFQEAYQLSGALLADSPDDPLMLFSHAKIAHEVRAFQEEISVLQKLIGIAEKEERPTSWYRVYLGQAFGTTGDAEGALREFGAALADPELPVEQREFAMDALKRVQSRVGENASLK